MSTAHSCRRPTYGGVLVSDLVSNIAHLAMTGVGVGAGYLIGKSMGDNRDAVVGALIGGGVGFVGGFYPTLALQRSLLRSPDCTNPSLSRVFGFRLAALAAITPIAFGARKLMPDKCAMVPDKPSGTMAGVVCKPNYGRQALVSALGTFGAPLLGMAVLKQNGN